MAFGLTPTGFQRKTLQTILAEIVADQRADIGPGINTEADALLGQMNAPQASKFAELWEVSEAVYNSQYPDGASNQSLDDVSSITGTKRSTARKSSVSVTVNINGGGFTLPAGSVAFVPTNADNTRFLTDEDVTNPGGAPDDFTVAMTAETAGAVVANAGALTGGPELVVGWNSATNPTDAVIGTAIELDPALRLRRLQEVERSGGSTDEAIRADVSAVEGVISVSVTSNRTLLPVNGIPGKAFEVVVLGGTDVDVAQAIFDSYPAGILAFGSTTVAVEDSQGVSQDISFTRPTAKPVFFEFDYAVDDDYPSNGDDLVKAAVKTFAEATFGQGKDVIASELNAPILGVVGVRDLTAIRLGFSVSPTGTVNLPITIREIATFDTADMVVATTPFVEA